MGDTITFCIKLSTCIYSSKEKLTLFPLKFTDESAGFALINTGGRESLNPPCGGTMLAQPEPLITLIEMIRMITANDIKTLEFINRLQT